VDAALHSAAARQNRKAFHRRQEMKKCIFIGTIILTTFLSSVFFSHRAYCAGIDNHMKAEMANMFIVMDQSFHRSFCQNDLSNAELINFGIANVDISYKKHHLGKNFFIPANKVSDAVRKYFGGALKRHESTDFAKYHGGFYEISSEVPLGDSEELNAARITRMELLDPQTVLVMADIVDPTLNDKFDRSEKAIFKKFGEGKNTHYVMWEYRVR
jgi:hypothetical protein